MKIENLTPPEEGQSYSWQIIKGSGTSDTRMANLVFNMNMFDRFMSLDLIRRRGFSGTLKGFNPNFLNHQGVRRPVTDFRGCSRGHFRLTKKRTHITKTGQSISQVIFLDQLGSLHLYRAVADQIERAWFVKHSILKDLHVNVVDLFEAFTAATNLTAFTKFEQRLTSMFFRFD